jgi:hypothetical protein
MAPLSTVHCDTSTLNNNNSYISTISHASGGVTDMTQSTGGVCGHRERRPSTVALLDDNAVTHE